MIVNSVYMTNLYKGKKNIKDEFHFSNLQNRHKKFTILGLTCIYWPSSWGWTMKRTQERLFLKKKVKYPLAK